MNYPEFEFENEKDGMSKLRAAVNLSITLRGNPKKTAVDNDIKIMVIWLEDMGIPTKELDEIIAPTKGAWVSNTNTPIFDGIYKVKFATSNWSNWPQSIQSEMREFKDGHWVNPNLKCQHDGWSLVQWFDEPGPFERTQINAQPVEEPVVATV